MVESAAAQGDNGRSRPLAYAGSTPALATASSSRMAVLLPNRGVDRLELRLDRTAGLSWRSTSIALRGRSSGAAVSIVSPGDCLARPCRSRWRRSSGTAPRSCCRGASGATPRSRWRATPTHAGRDHRWVAIAALGRIAVLVAIAPIPSVRTGRRTPDNPLEGGCCPSGVPGLSSDMADNLSGTITGHGFRARVRPWRSSWTLPRPREVQGTAEHAPPSSPGRGRRVTGGATSFSYHWGRGQTASLSVAVDPRT